MKEYKFQQLEVSDSAKIWLRAIKEDKESSDRELRLKLIDKLDDDFDPEKLPRGLIYEKRELSLLALWHLDSESQIFEVVDRVIHAVWGYLKENPAADKISADDICTISKMPVQSVECALGHIYHWHRFANGGQHSDDDFGFTLLHISEGYDSVSSYQNFDSVFVEMEKQFEMYSKSEDSQYSAITEMNIQSIMGAYSGAAGSKSKPEDSITIEPNTAFIIMPINTANPELEEVNKVIKEVCLLFDIKAVRADDIEHSKRITDVILKKIKTSQHIIADLSYERPNVYYEIGYAHAVGKLPVLYSKEGTNLHFDLKDYNVPSYKGVLDLRDKLIKRFQEITGKTLETK